VQLGNQIPTTQEIQISMAVVMESSFIFWDTTAIYSTKQSCSKTNSGNKHFKCGAPVATEHQRENKVSDLISDQTMTA
jgi:hypothetical protein